MLYFAVPKSSSKEMADKRKVAIQQQTFARHHKFEMEATIDQYFKTMTLQIIRPAIAITSQR